MMRQVLCRCNPRQPIGHSCHYRVPQLTPAATFTFTMLTRRSSPSIVSLGQVRLFSCNGVVGVGCRHPTPYTVMKIQEECAKIQKYRGKGPILEKRCFLLANIGLSHGYGLHLHLLVVQEPVTSDRQLLQTDPGDQICPLPTLYVLCCPLSQPSCAAAMLSEQRRIYQSRNTRI